MQNLCHSTVMTTNFPIDSEKFVFLSLYISGLPTLMVRKLTWGLFLKMQTLQSFPWPEIRLSRTESLDSACSEHQQLFLQEEPGLEIIHLCPEWKRPCPCVLSLKSTPISLLLSRHESNPFPGPHRCGKSEERVNGGVIIVLSNKNVMPTTCVIFKFAEAIF